MRRPRSTQTIRSCHVNSLLGVRKRSRHLRKRGPEGIDSIVPVILPTELNVRVPAYTTRHRWVLSLHLQCGLGERVGHVAELRWGDADLPTRFLDAKSAFDEIHDLPRSAFQLITLLDIHEQCGDVSRPLLGGTIHLDIGICFRFVILKDGTPMMKLGVPRCAPPDRHPGDRRAAAFRCRAAARRPTTAPRREDDVIAAPRARSAASLNRDWPPAIPAAGPRAGRSARARAVRRSCRFPQDHTHGIEQIHRHANAAGYTRLARIHAEHTLQLKRDQRNRHRLPGMIECSSVSPSLPASAAMPARVKNHRCCGGVINRQLAPIRRAASEPKSPVVIITAPPGLRRSTAAANVPRGSGRCSITSSNTMASTSPTRRRLSASAKPDSTLRPDWRRARPLLPRVRCR